MRYVAGERHGITGLQRHRLVADLDGDLALEHVQQLAGPRHVPVVRVPLTRAERPVPQFQDLRRRGTRDQHGPTAWQYIGTIIDRLALVPEQLSHSRDGR